TSSPAASATPTPCAPSTRSSRWTWKRDEGPKPETFVIRSSLLDLGSSLGLEGTEGEPASAAIERQEPKQTPGLAFRCDLLRPKLAARKVVARGDVLPAR